MTTDGLYYLPEGFRDGARQNANTADAAEGARRYLSQTEVNAAGYGGADAFPRALEATRDKQARGIAQAEEGRNNMAAADQVVAITGEEMDAAAGQALGAASVAADRGVADGV
ncbi:hypothetical protein ACTWP5_00815 [Streptomyces sp. 4N509B]|uniref:hypothetical protein n=1 Tax=Streptomyces sp. 4N509B TaxID=3457413 RepID=UPI003FD55B32